MGSVLRFFSFVFVIVSIQACQVSNPAWLGEYKSNTGSENKVTVKGHFDRNFFRQTALGFVEVDGVRSGSFMAYPKIWEAVVVAPGVHEFEVVYQGRWARLRATLEEGKYYVLNYREKSRGDDGFLSSASYQFSFEFAIQDEVGTVVSEMIPSHRDEGFHNKVVNPVKKSS